MSAARRLLLVVAVASCAKPTHGGSPGFDGGVDADGPLGEDAAPDAPSGTLSPEPVDPVNPPCAGMLGFPGAPGVVTYGGYRFAVGDLNGDGKKDVLVTGGSESRIALGAGDGTFSLVTTTALATDARDVRITDVNGDGKTDVAYSVGAAVWTEDFRVALGAGDGTFGPPQTLFSTTNKANMDQIEVVDLDGDGKKDLLSLSMDELAVAVSMNTGAGYGAPQFYSAGDIQYTPRMVVGDVTGDGRADVIATNLNESKISVLVNNGAGVFAPRVTYATPPSPWGIALVDANEDGKLDVVVGTSAASNQGQVSVLLNAGGGVFGPAVSYAVANYAEPRELAIADVDGDGHMDIGTAFSGASTLLFGTGTGQFGSALALPEEAGFALAFADLQNDGRIDALALTNGFVAVYLNRGGVEPFEARRKVSFDVPGSIRSARWLDLNDDARLDLMALSGAIDVTVPMWSKLADAHGSYGATTTTNDLLPASRTRLADLNNDGRSDIILGLGYSMQAVVNHGDGTLSAGSVLTFSKAARDFAIADVDGNGLRDLVVAEGDPNTSPYDGQVWMYPGLGNGNFGPGTMLWSGGGIFAIAAFDANGDGNVDIVFDSYSNEFSQDVLLGTGHGQFAPPLVTHVEGWPQSYLLARDLNKDGNTDLVGFRENSLVVMLGTGNGTFGVPLPSPLTVAIRETAFADVDGDAKLDLVIGAAGGVCFVRGHGDGMFDPPRCYPSGGGSSISVGDADGDGRLDVLVNNDRDRVSILYGRCLVP
jgi:hypothetical protein